MGKRCKQQYFQQQANYYQPRRNNCQQPVRTNCQQVMTPPSCAAPKVDSYTGSNATPTVAATAKEVDLNFTEAKLEEFGLDPKKSYNGMNFYKADFNVEGKVETYFIVHDSREGMKVPIYMASKTDVDRLKTDGGLWKEAMGPNAKSQHWKLANEALQKLVISKTQIKNLENKSIAPSHISSFARAGDYEKKDFKLDEVKRETTAQEPLDLRESIISGREKQETFIDKPELTKFTAEQTRKVLKSSLDPFEESKGEVHPPVIFAKEEDPESKIHPPVIFAKEQDPESKIHPPVLFASEPERRVQDRPALFDEKPVERAKHKLPNDPLKISISSISGPSSEADTDDDLPAKLRSENDASIKALEELKIKSISDSFKNKAYKIAPPDRGLTKVTPVQVPELKASKPVVSNPESKPTNAKPKATEVPMPTSPAKASKGSEVGKLFIFDDTALKTLEKIGPTAQKSIFGSYDPKNSTVERIASDDSSINLVYSHPGQDAIAIKVYKDGKRVNLKATATFASQDEAIEALKNTPASRLFTRTKEGGIYPLDRFPYLMYLINNGEAENSSYHSISADLKNILKESGHELVRKEVGQPYTGLKQK